VETLALGVVGLALGAGLRAWRDVHHPAHLAVVGLVAVTFLSAAAPRWYALQQSQTWGPPWEATRIRWAAVLLVGTGVVLLALRDPLVRGRDDVGPRSTSGTGRRRSSCVDGAVEKGPGAGLRSRDPGAPAG
jgi:hypothetical protein